MEEQVLGGQEEWDCGNRGVVVGGLLLSIHLTLTDGFATAKNA